MKKFKKFIFEKKHRIVSIYSGRFQPFHPGHYESYSELVKEFGKDNVYIGTSNSTDNDKSPFNFKEKKKIIITMFPDIPKDNIVQVKNPYSPKEITSKFSNDTSIVTGVGKKDADRLVKGKYFEIYKRGKATEPFRERGYVFVIPKNTKNLLDGKPFSGTKVRELLQGDIEEAFKKIYGKIEPKILKLFKGKYEKI